MTLLTIRVYTWVRAEVGRLVHIVPEAVDVYPAGWIEEFGELAVPILLGVGVGPVREDGWTRPHSTFIDRAILPYLPNVLLDTFVVNIVITSPNSRVNHDDVLLLVCVQMINHLADKLKRIPLGVESEKTTKLHVVDVVPHDL
jgi:hypothetical protein